MKKNSKITLTIGQLQKLVNETVFDQKELRALANESQWMSIEEYVKKNDLDLDEFLGCASSNGEPMPPDAKLPIDELDHYASNCEKSSKGYRQGKVFVFGIQWDTHDETTNPLPSRAKLTVPTPNGKADKQGIHDYLYSIYKVEPLDFDWEDLTNDLPHGMFAPSWGEQVKEAKKVKTEPMLNENTKFTLTIGQLKRLVKESRKLTVEHEEVSVVTPSGEHLGMQDDEGNFIPDEYPRDRFDCGEIVDDDGEYAKECDKFFKEYGYADAPSMTSGAREPEKYLMVSDKPKDEKFHEFFKEFWPKYLVADKDKSSSKECCDLVRQFKAMVRTKLPCTGNWADDDGSIDFMNIGGNTNKNGLFLLNFSYYGPSRPGRTDFHLMCFLIDEYGRIPRGASAYRELSNVDSINIMEKWKNLSDDE